MKYKAQRNALFPRGVVALFLIVLIAAASFIMAYGSALLGVGELDMGYVASRGREAFANADGCAEDALRRLRYDTGYTGGTYTLPNGGCVIIITTAGSTRTLSVTANVADTYFKAIQVDVTVGGDSVTGTIITVDSWKEISL